MTVTYSLECANCRLSTFFKLLLRWKGSIYKLLYKELLIFLIFYGSLSWVYRFALNDAQKIIFEHLSGYCHHFTNYIPVTFVLGFYVSLVVRRWWDQFCSIPFPDRFAIQVATYVTGADERGRMLRRTLVRLINLALVLCLRDISLATKKRFPTLEHLVESGFMSEAELTELNLISSDHPKYWVPIQWSSTLLLKTRLEGRMILEPSSAFTSMAKDLSDFREKLGRLMAYDWISVPLVYTQVVCLSVYSYFLACLLGRQFVHKGESVSLGEDPDLYFPVFTVLQFLFYVGWLKVGESLLNPFGEDDDDFEVNYLIDRHLQVSLLMVDNNYDKIPTVERDFYWDDCQPHIPHTIASVGLKTKGFGGSAEGITISASKSEMFLPDSGEFEHEDIHRDHLTSESCEVERPTLRRGFSLNTSAQRVNPQYSGGETIGKSARAYRRRLLSKEGPKQMLKDWRRRDSDAV